MADGGARHLAVSWLTKWIIIGWQLSWWLIHYVRIRENAESFVFLLTGRVPHRQVVFSAINGNAVWIVFEPTKTTTGNVVIGAISSVICHPALITNRKRWHRNAMLQVFAGGGANAMLPDFQSIGPAGSLTIEHDIEMTLKIVQKVLTRWVHTRWGRCRWCRWPGNWSSRRHRRPPPSTLADASSLSSSSPEKKSTSNNRQLCLYRRLSHSTPHQSGSQRHLLPRAGTTLAPPLIAIIAETGNRWERKPSDVILKIWNCSENQKVRWTGVSEAARSSSDRARLSGFYLTLNAHNVD